jgi:hypothetical protein
MLLRDRALLYKPVSVAGGLGPDLVIGGDFSNPASWTADAGWSVTGGQGVATGTLNFLWQNNASILAGHTYQVTYTLVSRTDGAIGVYLGSSVTFGTLRFTPGTYTENITPTGGGELGFQGQTGGSVSFAGVIDNFIVKEVL